MPVGRFVFVFGVSGVFGVFEKLLLAAALATSACTFDDTGYGVARDAAPPDAAPPADAACDASSYVDLCAAGPPGAPLEITGAVVLDTDTDARCQTYPQPGGPDACLIHVSGVTLLAGASLTAVGQRPLLLAATGDIQIDGLLDVSSHRDADRGAGADFAGCPAATPPESDVGGAGAAAGGSFASVGGAGGVGDSDDSLGLDGTGAGGGAAAAQPLPAFVRGGCPGLAGGAESDVGGQGGAGGSSGGSVYLYARGQLRVGANGVIRATGAGGAGGAVQAGGGGGGSGGFVGLEAATIVVAGQLSANGGGGGGGGGRISAVPKPGGPGADGDLGTTGAEGGIASREANQQGVGGRGAAGADPAENGHDDVVGAGAGGGGVGFVLVRGPLTLTGTSSPAPTMD